MPTEQQAGTGWVSGSGLTHLDLNCSGLDRMREYGHDPAEKFEPTPYTHPRELVDRRVSGQVTTLCRLCGVEDVVEDILATHPLGYGNRIFVTFTLSRPPALDRKLRKKRRRDSDADRAAALATEASQRLRRIAERAHLETTRTVRGPAAFGFISTDALEALSRVVHVAPRYTVEEVPDAELVSTFWMLLTAESRDEGVVDPETGDSMDPWYLADMICHKPT